MGTGKSARRSLFWGKDTTRATVFQSGKGMTKTCNTNNFYVGSEVTITIENDLLKKSFKYSSYGSSDVLIKVTNFAKKAYKTVHIKVDHVSDLVSTDGSSNPDIEIQIWNYTKDRSKYEVGKRYFVESGTAPSSNYIDEYPYVFDYDIPSGYYIDKIEIYFYKVNGIIYLSELWFE